MKYLGSKSKYAKYIVPILQRTIDENNVKMYIEPFCGGCNIIDKIKCDSKFTYDQSDTLIALLQAAATNFDTIPLSCDLEMWKKGKGWVKDGIMPEDMTMTEIGATEWLGSFCAGGFPRGMAKDTPTRHYYQEAYNNLKKQSPNLKGIEFKCQPYWELSQNLSNAVIYCDPPYEGTIGYNYKNKSTMNYTNFWNWIRLISQNNYVFVSEQHAPDDFEIIWEKEVKRTTNKDNNYKATEKLFVLKK